MISRIRKIRNLFLRVAKLEDERESPRAYAAAFRTAAEMLETSFPEINRRRRAKKAK